MSDSRLTSRDVRALVVPPQHEEVLRVLDFVCEKKTYGFPGLFTAIDVVSQEQVVGFWREAAVLEQSEQVVVLAVDIA